MGKRYRAELVKEISGHTDRAWSLSWSPSQPLLTSSSTDKSIRLSSFLPSSPSLSFSPSTPLSSSHSRTIRSVAFSPTGSTLASASFDSTVGMLYHQKSGEGDGEGDGGWEEGDALEGHESEVKCVGWSRDGRWVASCGRDKSVWVWEVLGPQEFECAAVLMEHSQDVKSLSWHPTEELLLSTSYDDTLHLYHPSPYDDEWTLFQPPLKSHTGTVWSGVFSPCGNYLISGGDDLRLVIWKKVPIDRKGEVVDSAEGEGGEKDDGEEGGRRGPWSEAYGSEIRNKTKWVYLTDLVNPGDEEEGGGFDRSIYSIDWTTSSAAGSLGRVVVGSGDGTVRVYELEKPNSTSTLAPPTITELVRIEQAHGVSDVNCVKWCAYDPVRAGKLRRSLEGDEGAEDGDEGEKEESGEVMDRYRSLRENVWASAGDDGVVRVWRLVEVDETIGSEEENGTGEQTEK